jgi:NAD(P)H-flavin reductase
MKKVEGTLINIWQDGKAACFEFEISTQLIIVAGQFLMVRSETDILPVPVYPIDTESKRFSSLSSAGNHWIVGDRLHFSGPHGKGFEIPSVSRRLLMISSTSTPLRLIPPAMKIIHAGGEAALYAEYIPENLPSEVELLSKEQLVDALSWADCIIGDVRIKMLSKWMELFAGKQTSPLGHGIQLLVDTPLVCTEAVCGVCMVKTRHGWKYACTEGPVFLLDDLEMQ